MERLERPEGFEVSLWAAEPLLANARDAAWSSDVEGRPRTGYELEWRAEGRTLHFFTYTRSAS